MICLFFYIFSFGQSPANGVDVAETKMSINRHDNFNNRLFT